MIGDVGFTITKKTDAEKATEIFENAKGCEISRYNTLNKSTFLHIFDYQQNKDLKKQSKLIDVDLELCLYLYAPDVESYARLSYEISEIERMKGDFMQNKKKYFDKKHYEDLIAYDNNLQIIDFNDNARSKTMTNIRKNKLYQNGQKIGHDLKKKYNEGHDKKIENINKKIINDMVSLLIFVGKSRKKYFILIQQFGQVIKLPASYSFIIQLKHEFM